MNRVAILTATFLIGVASTAVIATAKGGPGKHGGPRGVIMEQMFERLDADKNGAITKEEIAAAALARFTEADTDGNGLLSADEMKAAAEAKDSERRAKRIEARIEKLDTDGDGQISLEEMQARDSRMDRMFEKLDADSDGSITKAEAEAAKAMRGHGHRNK